VDRLSAFFDLVQQDPLVSQVKLIAEPWDVGEGGYQVGKFPPLWTEWNGKYRDTVRDYWRGSPGHLPELASRLTGSSDLYETSARRPVASVNFVTCHDGFTLADLVSYNRKHNEANLEDNHDGTNDNRSWNCGTEGPTDDPEINALRDQQVRNFLVTLFLSQGIPMLLAGDELGRTQGGNNNGYCQDNEVSWIDWDSAAKHSDLIEFVATLSALRKAHPVFRRRRFFSGQAGDSGDGQRDIIWLSPAGHEMGAADWNAWDARALAVCVNGDAITEPGPRGERITDADFILLINANGSAVTFTVPASFGSVGVAWEVLVDTGVASSAGADGGGGRGRLGSGVGWGGSVLNLEVGARSIVVLRGSRFSGA
jgi:glycogen operon protein